MSKINSINENREYPDMRLGWGERLGYGSGGVGIRLITSVLGTYLMIYLTNTALLDVAVISFIIAISKVFDGISDLIIGNVIDHTESKIGKARIWLMRMCIPFAAAFMLLFWVPPHFPAALKYVYVFLMYNIVNTVFFTFLQISHFSLISLMSSDKEEHGFLSVVASLSKSIGALLGSMFFVKLLTAFSGGTPNQYTQKGFTMACLVLCIVSVCTILITVFTVKERVKDGPVAKAGKRLSVKQMLPSIKIILSDRCWLTIVITQIIAYIGITLVGSGATYYSMYVLHDMGNMSWLAATAFAPSIVIQFLGPWLIGKTTKKRIFVGGTLLYCAGCLGFALVSPLKAGMIAFNLIKSVGTGLFGSVTLGIVADVVSRTKKKTGHFIPGAGFAGLSAADKLGQGLGNVSLGLILASAGLGKSLDPSAASPSVVNAASWIFLWLPLICGLITAILFLLFYDLDENELKTDKSENDQQQ